MFLTNKSHAGRLLFPNMIKRESGRFVIFLPALFSVHVQFSSRFLVSTRTSTCNLHSRMSSRIAVTVNLNK